MPLGKKRERLFTGHGRAGGGYTEHCSHDDRDDDRILLLFTV